MKTRIRSFGEVNFGNAKLGDARRTKRLVRTANQMCRRPGGSLPQKLRNPKDLRAFYRLVNCDKVTHESILASHREAIWKTISRMQSTVLVLHDATELDYQIERWDREGNLLTIFQRETEWCPPEPIDSEGRPVGRYQSCVTQMWEDDDGFLWVLGFTVKGKFEALNPLPGTVASIIEVLDPSTGTLVAASHIDGRLTIPAMGGFFHSVNLEDPEGLVYAETWTARLNPSPPPKGERSHHD